jgi:hypothetical protein
VRRIPNDARGVHPHPETRACRIHILAVAGRSLCLICEIQRRAIGQAIVGLRQAELRACNG